MIYKYFIILVPILYGDRIDIQIRVASNKDDVNITHFGKNKKLISEKEVELFNLTDNNLKYGTRIELGKTPDDVFLKDPTPFGNLYGKYKWFEVKRVVSVKNTKVVAIINETVVIKMHERINNTTDSIHAGVALYENVENTVYSTWLKDGLQEDEFYYNLTVDFKGKAYQFVNKWRNHISKSVITEIGISKKGFIKIKPGEVILTKLTGLKIILLIEIDYVAYLTGNVIANYARLYGKHHFWSITVSNIMQAAKLNTEIHTTELIEIRCHTDLKLDVFNKATSKKAKIVRPTKKFRFIRKDNR